MKLFHKENEKEVVYVQMQDIMYLEHETDVPIPASIHVKILTGLAIVDDSNRFNFVKFDDENDVEFFKKLDFIIDFNEYKDLTDCQLEQKRNELLAKGNDIAEKWNSMSLDERRKNASLPQEFRNIDYMLKFIVEIYSVKHKFKVMPFPEFIDVK